MSEEIMRSEHFSAAIAGLIGTGLVAGGMGVLSGVPAFAAPSQRTDSAREAGRPLAHGEILSLRLASDRDFRYLAYVPNSIARGAPMLVSVHGISRNAREHLRLLAPLAERYGVVLLAPRYGRDRFPSYQRLLPDDRGVRPDALLRAAARELAARSGASDRRLYLFGYSGGAQFVHRFAMHWPEQVARYALGAAGWYTFPDSGQRYPYGLQPSRRHDLGGIDLDAFLGLPGLVLVGERDVHKDDALRASRRLERQQGSSRMERAGNWVAAVNSAASHRALPAPVRFDTLPRSPHSFARSMRRGGMGEKVFRHFFGAGPR
ncbi:MAG: hypothetical protein KDG52_09245 [Rhodocyclaceae bacterium]|nr:hypothetical protein [Rhodocyclaceae bacterium]